MISVCAPRYARSEAKAWSRIFLSVAKGQSLPFYAKNQTGDLPLEARFRMKGLLCASDAIVVGFVQVGLQDDFVCEDQL